MRTRKYHRTAVRGSQSRCSSVRFPRPEWAPQARGWVGGCVRRYMWTHGDARRRDVRRRRLRCMPEALLG
ncbi:hypothetical protein HYPSUDRAFT_60408 [Hypholoma sublateritium FD-334 SS-4]|uniref:Uncharacterized protein n=1 Tax=Hypholoma sublateritium (strain FD-334 SS-4) TaxID=945553 RepID=A0A0D2PFL9_HYPSF|nr:hypothetical protein HYPSUDRAFT_60408 [Hypholoma sublateritium FD-334 SS-4]